MTSLWRNVSINAVANSNWSCLFSAPKVHWKVQPTAARRSSRFNNMHGGLHAFHLSVNNASMRNVHKCLKKDNGYLITLQIWMERRYRVWRATHETILKPSSQGQTVSELKVTEKICNNFLQIQLIKLSRVIQVVWQEYVNCDGKHSKHLSLLKKSVALMAFAPSWIVEAIFDNISTAKLPW